MTLDELIAWCDPKTPMGQRPEQTRTTWQEITDALRWARDAGCTNECDTWEVDTLNPAHTINSGPCTCGYVDIVAGTADGA